MVTPCTQTVKTCVIFCGKVTRPFGVAAFVRGTHAIVTTFPQFTSFHSVFHSFHGLMNSINWPASSVWVFIAQLGEHCSANAEATGSNPVEAPKNVFSGYFRNCLNCDSLRWSHTHFICIPAVHIISFSVSFLSRVDELNKLASLQYMGLHSSAGRALQR